MDIESIINDILVFTQDNVIVSVVIGFFILFLIFRHPKVLLIVSLFFVAAYGLAWLFGMLSKAGLG